MRPSSKKIPAAVLRSIIGIKDSEMAELLQCSPATIHSIESGRLKVSDMMAMKMYDQTGVSPNWLRGGDPKRPITEEGKPYTRAAYDRAQNEKKLPDPRRTFFFREAYILFIIRLRAILAHAEQKGDVFIPIAKTGRFLTSLASAHVKDYAPPTGPRSVTAGIKRELANLATIKQDIRFWSRSRKRMLAQRAPPAAKRDSARQTERG
jgi:hypothetical protein